MTTPDRQQNVLATVLTIVLALALVAGLALLGSAAYHAFLAPPPAPAPAPTASPASRNTPVPTATAAPRPTATGTPLPAATATSMPTVASGHCDEALADGGFEAGEGWTLVQTAQTAGYVNQPAEYVTNPVRTGKRAVRVGIDGSRNLYSYSAVDQAVSIPADATSATLICWALPLCGAADGDIQYILVLKGDGTFDVLLWEQRNATDWQRLEFPLDAYRGQDITIRFGARNDGQGDTTAMYVDDVSLMVCYETTPTPYAE